jgi:FkbM family methyltransferase
VVGELLLRIGNLVLTRSYPASFQYLRKNLWLHQQQDWKVRCFHPDVRFNAKAIVSNIESIYFFGYTPSTKDVCVEVGADIGLETIYMSRLVGDEGTVYAIEASPTTFEVLCENTSNNALRNVVLFNLAISNTNEQVRVSTSIGNHISNRIINVTEDFYDVEAKTMDEFIADNNISRIDYMKVNIEGAEALLVDSFSKIHLVENIAISCHDFLGERTGEDFYFTREKIEEFLTSNNFTVDRQSSGVDSIDDWIYGHKK